MSQHRPSSSAGSGAMPMRSWHSRQHSHTLSLGSVNQTGRVTRRKSMTSSAASNLAAVAAALKEGDHAWCVVPSSSARKGMPAMVETAKAAECHSTANANLDPSGFSSLHGTPYHAETPFNVTRNDESIGRRRSAITDETSTSPGLQNHNKHVAKARSRRASEGSQLLKSDGRRESGNELRCETCGKAYKHGSCLVKHLFVDPSRCVLCVIRPTAYTLHGVALCHDPFPLRTCC